MRLQTAFYMSVGCISYAGFGNAAPGNLVTGAIPLAALSYATCIKLREVSSLGSQNLRQVRGLAGISRRVCVMCRFWLLQTLLAGGSGKRVCVRLSAHPLIDCYKPGASLPFIFSSLVSGCPSLPVRMDPQSGHLSRLTSRSCLKLPGPAGSSILWGHTRSASAPCTSHPCTQPLADRNTAQCAGIAQNCDWGIGWRRLPDPASLCTKAVILLRRSLLDWTGDMCVQVYMQPFMTFVEDSICHWFPSLKWQKEFDLPYYGYFPLSPLKLVSRTIIVATTTLLVG